MRIFMSQTAIAVLASLVVVGGLQTFAFTEPGSTPPLGDAYAPLNTGPSVQDKTDTTGHAAWITADGVGSRYGAVFASLSGNVGIGTTSPAVKLDVNGEIKVGYAGVTCANNTAGTLRWSGGVLQVCDGTTWESVSTDSGVTWLVNANHTTDSCTANGGTLVDIGNGQFMCKFIAGSCPNSWTQYQQWSVTISSHCGNSNCGSNAVCDTGYHSTFSNLARETCNSIGGGPGSYQCTNFGECTCVPEVCYAAITQIGCY